MEGQFFTDGIQVLSPQAVTTFSSYCKTACAYTVSDKTISSG